MGKNTAKQPAKSRSIKVVGVRHKEIDTAKLAMAYWLQVRRIAQEKKRKEQGQ